MYIIAFAYTDTHIQKCIRSFNEPLIFTVSPFSPRVNSENGFSLASIKVLCFLLSFCFNCLWQEFLWNARCPWICIKTQHRSWKLFESGIINGLQFTESTRLNVSSNRNCLEQVTDLNIFLPVCIFHVPENQQTSRFTVHSVVYATHKQQVSNNDKWHKQLHYFCITNTITDRMEQPKSELSQTSTCSGPNRTRPNQLLCDCTLYLNHPHSLLYLGVSCTMATQADTIHVKAIKLSLIQRFSLWCNTTWLAIMNDRRNKWLPNGKLTIKFHTSLATSEISQQ